MRQITFKIGVPEKLEATGNARLHPMALARLRKEHRDRVEFFWPSNFRGVLAGVSDQKIHASAFRLAVTFTRTMKSPGLDDDNLRTSFKAHRDEVTRELGLRTDKDTRITWNYREAYGPASWSIRIDLGVPDFLPLHPTALEPRAARRKAHGSARATPSTHKPKRRAP